MVGSAINANGGNAPLMAQSGLLQRRCIEAAFKDGGHNPDDVDYIELHTTGESRARMPGSGD